MSGSTSKGRASGASATVVTTSGLYAGAGGYDVTVGGVTTLNGAALASSADASRDSLTTAAITSYSSHAITQIAERDGVGVSQAAIEDAFANPTAIQYVPSKYGPTFKYIGRDATVVVNPEGKAVTAWELVQQESANEGFVYGSSKDSHT